MKRRWREGHGGGGELFEGCNFYIFPSNGGNYSRETINQGTAIINFLRKYSNSNPVFLLVT